MMFSIALHLTKPTSVYTWRTLGWAKVREKRREEEGKKRRGMEGEEEGKKRRGREGKKGGRGHFLCL